MSEVLIYNFRPDKEAKLKLLCRRLYIGARTVDESDYGCQLTYLLGLSDDSTRRDSGAFTDEMLYIVGLRGGMLNLFLDQLKRQKLSVSLKAVQTETNLGFTSYELYRELCAEREAIAKGQTAHNT